MPAEVGGPVNPFPNDPREEWALFRAAWDLTFQSRHFTQHSLKDREALREAPDGQGLIRADHAAGRFRFQAELQLTVPENIVRYWVWIWYENLLVFDAWYSVVNGGGPTGLILTCTDGPWRHHLRKRWEAERTA